MYTTAHKYSPLHNETQMVHFAASSTVELCNTEYVLTKPGTLCTQNMINVLTKNPQRCTVYQLQYSMIPLNLENKPQLV